MTRRNLRTRLALAGIGAILAASILGGGVAKADQASDYAAINAGTICSTLDDFPTVAGVTGVLQGVIQDSGMTPYDSGRAIATAVKYWCPRNIPVLQRFIAAYKDAGVMVA